MQLVATMANTYLMYTTGIVYFTCPQPQPDNLLEIVGIVAHIAINIR